MPAARRRPVVTQRTSRVACDNVLLALGQDTRDGFAPRPSGGAEGRAWQGEKASQVWFAGDCASGDGTVTHAIGNGRRAALTALEKPDGGAGIAGRSARSVAPAKICSSHFEVVPPHRDRQIPPSVRRASFEEISLGLSGPEEAGRCFSCGHPTHCDTCLIYCPDGVIYRTENGYRIDADYCKGCGMCVAECPRNAMEMHEKSKQEVSACL